MYVLVLRQCVLTKAVSGWLAVGSWRMKGPDELWGLLRPKEVGRQKLLVFEASAEPGFQVWQFDGTAESRMPAG